MMNLTTLIQMVFVAFLAWGGVLSLLYLAGGETGFRRVLSRRDAVTAVRSGSIA